MNSSTPLARKLARRLIAPETDGNASAGAKGPAAFRPGEMLRPHLEILMGNVGFRSLLSRALALANDEIPWLRAVHVKSDGSLEGLAELEAQVDPKEIVDGKVVLLAHLLGLLVTFIGETLTLQLVREAWPKLSLADVDLSERLETKNEKS